VLPHRVLAVAGFADLRIAVVTPFLDRRHGTERALAEQVERLASQYQCEIHVYAQRVEDVPVKDPRTLTGPEAGAILWHRVPSLPGPHLIQYIAWFVCNGVFRWFSTRGGRLEFDLVFSAGINCLDADAITVHALFHRLWELSRSERRKPPAGLSFPRRLHRRLYYRFLSALERRIYSNPKLPLAAVSQRTADLLTQYFQRRDVEVIPNGVDATHFSISARVSTRRRARSQRNFSDNDFVMLLMGNDWGMKGVPAILAAMAGCPSLRLHLLAVGEEDPTAFRELASRMGIADRCRWEHPVSNVIDLYAAADAYVSPSREDSFGLPVLEAMACGLPVITSVFAGVSDLIHNEVDGFILSDPDDSRTLTQVLRDLYNNQEYRQHIGLAGANTAQQWTWDRNAEALWKLLTGIAASKKKRRSNT
jgi:glycosyltransferase involved in cell wall biosynthesis